MTAAERFWSKVRLAQPNECAIWTGDRNLKGYGRFSLAGKRVPAHRWAYEAVVGPVRDGLVMDHLCRNPSCVNPGHLEPVTVRENTLRGECSALRIRKTHCKRGHERTPENLYASGRNCRKCLSEWHLTRRPRKP